MKNNFKYFNQCNNLQDVKTVFRQLAKQFHSDLNNGNDEEMKILNNEYDLAFKYFQDLDNSKIKDETKHNKESANIYKNIIEKLIHYENINIEIVGSWLWLDGNTYPIKELIKELNFRWSKSKKKWYYFDNIQESNKKRGFYSYDKIVEKYGVTKIENDPFKRI